jgi:hypothetical protein
MNPINKQLQFNEEHKMQHKLQIEKIKSYLLGNKKTSSNLRQNTLGFVLAFNTKIKHKNVKKGYYKLALLLYLNVRTARVERYLMNSSDTIANERSIDFKPDLFYTWNNEQYKIFHEDDYITKGVTMSSQLGDGKLSTRFYNLFMFEMIRDYFTTDQSYQDGNMATLKKITAPSHFIYQQNPETVAKENKDFKLGLGAGVLKSEEAEAINQNYIYKKDDLQRIVTPKFDLFKSTDKTSSDTPIIYVPKTLQNKTIEKYFEHKTKLVYAKRNELPQIVKDLTRTLSIKTVDSPYTITHRIKAFNYYTVKNLTQMKTKYKHPIENPFG